MKIQDYKLMFLKIREMLIRRCRQGTIPRIKKKESVLPGCGQREKRRIPYHPVERNQRENLHTHP